MSETPTTHQLDFYQAMQDFRLMFPTMDEEVIEAVLRSNSGAVDATIDQLLTMNVDCGDGEDSPKHAEFVALSKRGSIPPELLGSSSSSEADSFDPPPYSEKGSTPLQQPPPCVAKGGYPPPPSYQEYTASLNQSLPAVHTARSSSGDLLQSEKALLEARLKALDQQSRLDAEGQCELLGATGGGRGVMAAVSLSDTTPKQPLPVGDLICVDSVLPPTPAAPKPPKMPVKMPLFNHQYTPSAQKLGPKRLYKGWKPPLLGNLPEDFLRVSLTLPAWTAGDASRRSPRTASPVMSPGRLNGGTSPGRTGSASPRLQSYSGSSPSSQQRNHSALSCQMLQQKLVENELKLDQHSELDAATLQCLEDERLALVVQNEEFLVELQNDPDFMRTLERDRMNATAFEPAPDLVSPDLDTNRPKSDFIEGYGDDRDVTLGAFPFDRGIEDEAQKDAEFRHQLKNMGGSSRKKFVAIARGFFSRKKKKSPRQMYPYPGYAQVQNMEGYEHLAKGGDSLHRDGDAGPLPDNGVVVGDDDSVATAEEVDLRPAPPMVKPPSRVETQLQF